MHSHLQITGRLSRFEMHSTTTFTSESVDGPLISGLAGMKETHISRIIFQTTRRETVERVMDFVVFIPIPDVELRSIQRAP